MFINHQGNSEAVVRIIWLHGWGVNHATLLKLSNLFNNETENLLLDLPGFGKSAPPPEIWGSAEYTTAFITWLQTLPHKTTYIVSHSFGGRIAIQAAQLRPDIINGIVLIAASGLKKKRGFTFKIKAYILKCISKSLKIIDNHCNTNIKDKFSSNFGSHDYKAAFGIMKSVFVKIVHEDLSNIASLVQVATLLIYGSKDQETPVEFGKTYNNLIKNSSFIELPGFDHYSILSYGQHQLYNLITQFIQRT